ncbi:MAG: penicillin-binding protein [Cyanothece sp. SIO1E1]|nr:penicillin-binding protein [Cyanothece sp. SIO1E1]
MLGLSAGIAGGATSAYQLWQTVESSLPDAAELLTFVRDDTLTIQATDGAVLQQLGPATREQLTIDEIPNSVIQAFVASEDRRFYEHEGIDYRGIARAIAANLLARDLVEGASTITQQLARIVFLDQERSLQRKFREALLARKIERELTKEQILERYLNLVYLGANAYGVADATWVYFSKPIDQLTISESAMLAGMAPAPSLYSPLISREPTEPIDPDQREEEETEASETPAYSPQIEPEAATQRRNIVLRRMLQEGFISEAEAAAALASPLDVKPSLPKNLYSQAPYFTSYVQKQLAQFIPPEELEVGGLTVETTLNFAWQQAAQAAVKYAIEERGPGQGFKQAALTAIDPRTGEIKAMVGGNDFNQTQFNRVTQAQRQPGSTFKTLLYTTAIATGISPEKTYVDAKYLVDGYEPKNYRERYRGTVSLHEALIRSINVVAVKNIVDVGFKPVIDLAYRMGIKSKLLPTYSLALGASEVNLLELTSAYSTLAAAGQYIEPHGIVKVVNRRGEVIYEADFEDTEAIDAETTAITTWMLQGVVEKGTGRQARIDRPVAGKTGTSEEARDLWFIGYIPQLVAGVWLGNDDNSKTYGASGTAARTWREFMEQVVEGMPVVEFPPKPDFENRKGTLKAQPVKPKKVKTTGVGSSRSDRERRSRRDYRYRQEREAERNRSESRWQETESTRESADRLPTSGLRERPGRESNAPNRETAPDTDAPAPNIPATTPSAAPIEPSPAPAEAPVPFGKPLPSTPAPAPSSPPTARPVEPRSEPVPLPVTPVAPSSSSGGDTE